jgi:hypothetical protein
MINFPPYPIPVIIKHDKSEGYILYVSNNGMYENDVFCVVSCNGGDIKHYLSDQILIYKNETFTINKK